MSQPPKHGGCQIGFSVIIYCLCVAAIPIYAKRIFDGSLGVKKFPYPCLAASFQLTAASCLLLLVHLALRAAAGSSEESWLFGPHFKFKLSYVATPGIAFGLKYAVTNVALSLVDNSTHVLLGATEIVWVLILASLVNGEKLGILEALAASVSVAGNFIVAWSLAKGIHAPLWPLLLNLVAPFVGALCICTLRRSVERLMDPENRLKGTMTKIEFTVLKLSIAALAAFASAMLLENGAWSLQGQSDAWWTALGNYPLRGTLLILSTGIFNAILHVNLAALAWLTSATAVGLLSELKVLPQWLLNQAFGVRHATSTTYLLGAVLGMLGCFLYALASQLSQRQGKIVLGRTGFRRMDASDSRVQLVEHERAAADTA